MSHKKALTKIGGTQTKKLFNVIEGGVLLRKVVRHQFIQYYDMEYWVYTDGPSKFFEWLFTIYKFLLTNHINPFKR